MAHLYNVCDQFYWLCSRVRHLWVCTDNTEFVQLMKCDTLLGEVIMFTVIEPTNEIHNHLLTILQGWCEHTYIKRKLERMGQVRFSGLTLRLKLVVVVV